MLDIGLMQYAQIVNYGSLLLNPIYKGVVDNEKIIQELLNNFEKFPVDLESIKSLKTSLNKVERVITSKDIDDDM